MSRAGGGGVVLRKVETEETKRADEMQKNDEENERTGLGANRQPFVGAEDDGLS
jgi:hypothetical protein